MVENEREEGLGSFIGTVVSTGQESFSCMCAYMSNTDNFSKIPIPGGKHQYRYNTNTNQYFFVLDKVFMIIV